MNPDQKLIQSAYEDAIKKLYPVLLEGYAQANGDPSKEQLADQHFTKGVAAARIARDRAISLLA
jgi:hypothetical protein